MFLFKMLDLVGHDLSPGLNICFKILTKSLNRAPEVYDVCYSLAVQLELQRDALYCLTMVKHLWFDVVCPNTTGCTSLKRPLCG